MVNPVEVISRSSKRLARLAVAEVAAAWLLPILLTVAYGLFQTRTRNLIQSRYGYVIDPHHATLLIQIVLGLAIGELIASVWLARRAWSQTNDFAATAEKIDDAVGARQEVVTLATLADPTHPEQKEHRSPLFAMLWRRVIEHLERFNPQQQFRFDAKEPLWRSSILSGVVIVALGLATLSLMRVPSVIEAASYGLRQLADKIDTPSATASDHQVAEALRDVAKDLESPRVPPQQKLAELQSIKQEIAKIDQQRATGENGSGNGSGGNSSGSGEGTGKGTTGKGEGKGQGQNGAEKGEGSGSGGPNKGAQGDKESLQLQNNLAKAQAKLEEENNLASQSNVAQNQGKTGTGLVPQPGSNPNQGGPQSKPNGTGNIQMPGAGKLADSHTPPGSTGSSPNSGDKGSQGDTHLGQFPKAGNYERYYRLGDKGPPIDIQNARYVTFRLPTSVIAGGEASGKTVQDAGSPTAKTPYSNAPLKEERVAASPDEEQLLPPRYRDLIR